MAVLYMRHRRLYSQYTLLTARSNRVGTFVGGDVDEFDDFWEED